MQPDLFEPPMPERCGTCVVWNGRPCDTVGSCSVHGQRLATDPPCERSYGRQQLNAALYGRKGAA